MTEYNLTCVTDEQNDNRRDSNWLLQYTPVVLVQRVSVTDTPEFSVKRLCLRFGVWSVVFLSFSCSHTCAPLVTDRKKGRGRGNDRRKKGKREGRGKRARKERGREEEGKEGV